MPTWTFNSGRTRNLEANANLICRLAMSLQAMPPAPRVDSLS
jgi:hypothetical protein